MMKKTLLLLFLIHSIFSAFGADPIISEKTSSEDVAADITLCVDLSCFTTTTAPALMGTFNGWCANCNFLTDQGGGTWCTTVTLNDGPQEYKFFFQEEGQEDMTPGDPCTTTNFGFTNRVVNVVNGVNQTFTYGWEVCDPTCPPPPATTDIELCVDLSCFTLITAPTVFGAFNGWNAGANPITDPDGDGTYCATVGLTAGAQEYKFFFQEEGPEDMTPGDPCTVTNSGFTNRVVNVVAGVPQSLTYGWEVCGATCPPPPATTDIELCVDLSCFTSVTAPTVFGAFNGWNAGANPITDPDGDGTYCATVGLLAGDQEYKFFFQEEGPEDMTPGDPCTVTNFGFTNRMVTVVDGVPQSLTYGWETCDPSCGAAPVTTDIELCVDLSCYSSITAPTVFGAFNGWNAGANPITDPDGDGTYCATVALLAGPQEYKFFFQEEGPEDMTPGDPCTVTNFGFTNRVVNVVEGVTQSLTYGWEVCDPTCPNSADVTFCVDLSCYPTVTAPTVFGAFNGWCANCNPVTDPDGDGIYCTTVEMPAGAQEYLFFIQEEGPENMTPGDPCTVTNFGFTNRLINVVAGVPQTVNVGWGNCGTECLVLSPQEAAPDPTCDEAAVISMFSNSYTDVPVDTWLTFWSQATLADIQVAGNDTKKYDNVDFLGIETVANQLDISDYTYLNLDIWTPNMTTFRVKLVDFGPNGIFQGGDDTEFEIPFTPAQSQWVTLQIPIADFTGMNTENISQLIFSGLPVGAGTVYVDNVYFSHRTYYADTDGDGFGDPASSMVTCNPPAGYVLDDTDCDDMAAAVNPAAIEIPCNDIDDDCVGGDYIAAEVNIIYPPIASPITCLDAENFTIGNATYDNGEAGINNISGSIAPVIVNFWNSCGGTIVVKYNGLVDLCGRTIESQEFTIDVQPAPVPTITLPTLPTSLTSQEALDYVAPTATASNGLGGACSVSGNVEIGVNHFYDACGGILELIYYGTDDCGRSMTAVMGVINVDQAPAPILSVPTYPTAMTCSEADGMVGMAAPYDNGMTGITSLSGFIQADVVKNVTAIDGGTITISYNGTDDCGNILSAPSIVIAVSPASSPTIQLPNSGLSISCYEAESYAPAPITFSNGENGFCENSGELNVTYMEHFWNSCDGGYIVMQYSGYDAGGNYMETDMLKMTVTPDYQAPQGVCLALVETLEDIKLVPGPSDLHAQMDLIKNNFYETCGEVVVNMVGDSGPAECGLDGTFERTYQVEVSDLCGNVAGVCSVTFNGKCNPLYCTMVQDFYASSDESFGGYSSTEMINVLMDSGNDPITIGAGDCGYTLDDADCVQAILSGSGQSISLSNGSTLDCGNPAANNLANQVITTVLNIRYNAMLNGSGLDFGNFQMDATCMYIPAHISAAMPGDMTVNDLIDYANGFLSCQCNGTCGDYQTVMSDLTGLFLGLNSRFNNCHVPGPCFLTSEGDQVLVSNEGKDKEATGAETTAGGIFPTLNFGKNNTSFDVQLFPNPARDILNIKIDEAIGQSVFVEIFNVQGKKMGEKSFDAMTSTVLEWDVNNFPTGMYWLSFNVEGQDQLIKKIIITD